MKKEQRKAPGIKKKESEDQLRMHRIKQKRTKKKCHLSSEKGVKGAK